MSKTRGEPSTSTSLKEALCEKIPVHHDLLRNFRFHFGQNVVSQITVENLYTGMSDVKTIVREISELDPKHGVIISEYLILESLRSSIALIKFVASDSIRFELFSIIIDRHFSYLMRR